MIKVGILGAGFGETHAELYKKIEGFQIVSIFGRNQEKLNNIGEKHNIQTTTDINSIITNPNIDLVDICLPTELHSEWAIEAMKNGKHVFCETPVAYNFNEAEAIRQASSEYKKNVFVNLFIKFSAPHKYAMDMIKNGNCGKLLGIRSYNKTSPRWGDLGLQKNVENFHIHMMDFVLELAGMPNSVTSSGVDYGGKSIVTSALKYDDAYAVIESNSALPECCPFEIGFELLCADGIIRFDAAYGEYTKEEFAVIRNGKPHEVLQVEEKDDYEEVIKHIRRCIQTGVKSEYIDIKAAINSIKLKEMIVQSLNK